MSRILTREIVQLLLPQHLRRYSHGLDQAQRGVPTFRADEMEVLLGLWQSMEAKGCDPARFLPEELAEARDAAYDEGLLSYEEPPDEATGSR